MTRLTLAIVLGIGATLAASAPQQAPPAPPAGGQQARPGGGLFPVGDGDKGITVYFETDDIDAERERISELGGSIDEKMPVPNMGWFAQGTDTEGNKFAVWQADDSAQMPEGVGAESTSSN